MLKLRGGCNKSETAVNLLHSLGRQRVPSASNCANRALSWSFFISSVAQSRQDQFDASKRLGRPHSAGRERCAAARHGARPQQMRRQPCDFLLGAFALSDITPTIAWISIRRHHQTRDARSNVANWRRRLAMPRYARGRSHSGIAHEAVESNPGSPRHPDWQQIEKLCVEKFLACLAEVATVGTVREGEGAIGQVAADQLGLRFDEIAVANPHPLCSCFAVRFRSSHGPKRRSTGADRAIEEELDTEMTNPADVDAAKGLCAAPRRPSSSRAV